MLIGSGLYALLYCQRNSYAHRLAVIPKLSTNFYAKFCTIKATLLYLFEQLLYPSSTALIMIIIIKEKSFKGVCA